jgi:hypothetical protein
MDSFPDSYWKIESCKIIANDENTFKTVAGYFTFKGKTNRLCYQHSLTVRSDHLATMLTDVFNDTIEEKFASIDLEYSKQVAQSRSKVQNVNVVGLYLLTLNKDMLVRNFELVFVSEVSKHGIGEL